MKPTLYVNGDSHTAGTYLKDKFNFASVQYADKLINTTKEYQTDTAIERFEVYFIIMTEILNKLFNDLLKIFKKE